MDTNGDQWRSDFGRTAYFNGVDGKLCLGPCAGHKTRTGFVPG